MKHLLSILSLLVVLSVSPAVAVEPSEMLADPALEARAQQLDENIRCVQCQSENIASSNADWARDARMVVRELISAGASDREVEAFFVERYGERVLMRPSMQGTNAALWLAGPIALLFAAMFVMAYLRKRTKAPQSDAPLSAAEQKRLSELLDE